MPPGFPVDRTDTDLTRVDLEMVGPVVGFMAELELWLIQACTERAECRSVFLLLRGALWQVPARTEVQLRVGAFSGWPIPTLALPKCGFRYGQPPRNPENISDFNA